jgi:hypothetical protein
MVDQSTTYLNIFELVLYLIECTIQYTYALKKNTGSRCLIVYSKPWRQICELLFNISLIKLYQRSYDLHLNIQGGDACISASCFISTKYAKHKIKSKNKSIYTYIFLFFKIFFFFFFFFFDETYE